MNHFRGYIYSKRGRLLVGMLLWGVVATEKLHRICLSICSVLINRRVEHLRIEIPDPHPNHPPATPYRTDRFLRNDIAIHFFR